MHTATTDAVSASSDEWSTVNALRVGDSVDIDGLGPMLVKSITQRNWSRVGIAERGTERYFLKQFVDRVGRAHPKGFDGDWNCVRDVGDEVAPGIRVIPAVGRSEDRLVIASPYVQMSTVDAIQHSDRTAGDLTKAVGDALASILEARRRDDRVTVDIWKGLDPKNLGQDEQGQIWVFDFGPATTKPLADAAARVAAAGLLSRWVARPGLHLIRPERTLIRNLCCPIAPLTDLQRVDCELDLHAQLRLREPQREGLAATLTRAGLLTLGNVHWRSLRREAARIFPDA